MARTSEYRRYQRRLNRRHQTRPESQKWSETHLEAENAPEQALNSPQSRSIRGGIIPVVAHSVGVGLRTRTNPPTNDFGELVCCGPYYNSKTNKVEWVERELYGKPVLHRCSLEKNGKNWRELGL